MQEGCCKRTKRQRACGGKNDYINMSGVSRRNRRIYLKVIRPYKYL